MVCGYISAVVMNRRYLKPTSAVLFLIIAAVFLWFYPDHDKTGNYYTNKGQVFGTYYTIRYQAEQDLEDEIVARLNAFDGTMSMFNDTSIVSHINRNEDVVLNKDFLDMYATAERVSALTDGAFDITVAPLVNAWGFGFRQREQVNAQVIDSLLETVGYEKISVFDNHLWKSDERTMLDASAIAKGQGCDVVAALLEDKGCRNYLVDIGGEVVCCGVNEKDEMWRIGISKPIDDPSGEQAEIQEIVSAPALCMATSGNYRQFYYDNGIRRSHTIDPRTGYPVAHSLLSATVIAHSCMEADALATACMVLGTDSALQLIDNLRDTECYLIYDESDTMRVAMSKGMRKFLRE